MKSIKIILNEILENLKQKKQIYAFREGCNYPGISASMLRNRQATMEEMEDKASSYSLNRKNSKK